MTVSLRKALETKARQLRKRVLELTVEHGHAHLGGCFSEIEILISLYDVILQKQDKFLLSKGHGYYPLYLLLKDKGCTPSISSHPNLDVRRGINCTSGSFGHGLPIGVGMALAKRIVKQKGAVYVLLGEACCQEGTLWESCLIASTHKLDNLTIIVDRNKFQALDRTENVVSLNKLGDALEGLGLHVAEVNGHDFGELIPALQEKVLGRPKVVIAHTVKGKGVSFMENDPKWHGRAPTTQEVEQARKELQ